MQLPLVQHAVVSKLIIMNGEIQSSDYLLMFLILIKDKGYPNVLRHNSSGTVSTKYFNINCVCVGSEHLV